MICLLPMYIPKYTANITLHYITLQKSQFVLFAWHCHYSSHGTASNNIVHLIQFQVEKFV